MFKTVITKKHDNNQYVIIEMLVVSYSMTPIIEI